MGWWTWCQFIGLFLASSARQAILLAAFSWVPPYLQALLSLPMSKNPSTAREPLPGTMTASVEGGLDE